MSLKHLTVLPRDRATNDVLKIEYLDVNLNNSRRLISALGETHVTSTEIATQVAGVKGCLSEIRELRKKLTWLENIDSKGG